MAKRLLCGNKAGNPERVKAHLGRLGFHSDTSSTTRNLKLANGFQMAPEANRHYKPLHKHKVSHFYFESLHKAEF